MLIVSTLISDLQAKWHTLPDFERARSVRPIIRAGLSRRSLANALNVSEGTIRGLLSVLEADPADQDLFRRGEISRNELVRRLKGGLPSQNIIGETPQQENRSDDSANVPERGSVNVSRLVLDWLREHPARSLNARYILREANRELTEAAEANKLPRDRAPIDMPVDEIIRRSRPTPERFEFNVAWYARWTALWAFYLTPDPNLCGNALTDALDKVLTGERSPELW